MKGLNAPVWNNFFDLPQLEEDKNHLFLKKFQEFPVMLHKKSNWMNLFLLFFFFPIKLALAVYLVLEIAFFDWGTEGELKELMVDWMIVNLPGRKSIDCFENLVFVYGSLK